MNEMSPRNINNVFYQVNMPHCTNYIELVNLEPTPTKRAARHPRSYNVYVSFKKWLAENVLQFTHLTSFGNLLCCTNPVDYYEYDMDRNLRKRVREEMCYTMASNGEGDCLDTILREAKQHGHNMLREEEVNSKSCAYYREVRILPKIQIGETLCDVYHHYGENSTETITEVSVVEQPVPSTRAKVSPKLVANIAMAIRVRLGQRPRGTPGNWELVERECLRLMRDHNMRNVDSCVHLPHVLNAYFDEDVHYRVPTSKSRISKWILRALGEAEPPRFEPSN